MTSRSGSLVLSTTSVPAKSRRLPPAPSSNGTISLLLAEDHTLFRETLRLYLEANPSYMVVGEAENGREAVEMALALKPDVVLMDLSLPLLNGLDATRRIRKETEEVRTLILTGHAYQDFIYQALEVGASGYLLKTASVDELQLALREVHRGNPYVSCEASKILIEDLVLGNGRGSRNGRGSQLTSRERELLQLFAEGYGNQEIAAQLFLSVKTVEAHKAHIVSKLNLHGKTDLLRYALHKGLIDS
ncbi:MAG: response regulator transcription factor [Chloroflexota bacterium]